MDHLTCDSCKSRTGPILPKVMGDGQTMHLCPQCRATWARDIDGEELAYWQGYWDGLMQQDVKKLAKAVVAELPSVIRHASGKRNF